jgi:hypothetical protein
MAPRTTTSGRARLGARPVSAGCANFAMRRGRIRLRASWVNTQRRKPTSSVPCPSTHASASCGARNAAMPSNYWQASPIGIRRCCGALRSRRRPSGRTEVRGICCSRRLRFAAKAATCGETISRSTELERCCAVPHQGVLLRGGSVARHLFAPAWGAWCGRATTREDSIS